MQAFIKFLVGVVNFLVVTLARNLPPWDKAPSIHLLPSIPLHRLTPPVNINYLPKSFAKNFKQSIAIPEHRIFI